MNSPGQLITEALHTITLHIYRKEMTPSQSITEALHTPTLLIYIYREREEGDEPPQSIDHSALAYHYTSYI